MPQIKPYLVIPNLIPQPTWGGAYIATLKQITRTQVTRRKIGQSYELYSATNLSGRTSTTSQPSLEIAAPSAPTQTTRLYQETPLNINQLIAAGPPAVLGARYLKIHGPDIKILNKLTQALGNSYQIHVSEPRDNWLPKPESWYFFEPGLISLGVKSAVDWSAFQATCRKISLYSQRVARKIAAGRLSLTRGRRDLSNFLAAQKIDRFVNRLQVAKDQAVDLSEGALHHSWEENPRSHPQGNILYEVQTNVFDNLSSIRSFDKGKIGAGGVIRPLQIEAYFRYINRTPQANDPAGHLSFGRILKKTPTYTVRLIFRTPFYCLRKLTFTRRLSNRFTQTQDSFHHLFVKQGNVQLQTATGHWTISRGFSIFIPASTGRYSLASFKPQTAQVLITSI